MRKICCFWDKCIWIGSLRFSLLRREYLSSTVNVLINSLKILHVTKRDLFQLNYLHSDEWIMWRCCRLDWNCVSVHLPCCVSKCPMKRDVLDNYLTMCFEVLNFGNTSVMRVIFYCKCSKFNVSLKNAPKNWEKVCCFLDQCTWVCCVKCSLLRREYLSSALYLLTNSLKILHITKRHFFQFNYLCNDQ